jgi:integrase
MSSKSHWTAKYVESIKQIGYHLDPTTKGLYLQVTNGSRGIGRTWIFRYTSPIYRNQNNQGKPRRCEIGFGPLKDRSLAEARQKAMELRKLILEGIEPLEAKKQATISKALAEAKRITFATAAKQCIESKKLEWKNEKHKAQWASTINTYVNPVIGKLSIQDIDTNLILKLFEQPIMDDKTKKEGTFWTVKTVTATRVRQRVEVIIDWAKAKGYFQGENPARLKGHLDHLLQKPTKIRKVKHHPAVPHTNVNRFVQELRSKKSNGALALEYLLLTATRTSETLLAKWDEIDMKKKVWSIPSEKTKTKQLHRVPLSTRACEILKIMKSRATGDYIFPSQISKTIDKPMSNMTLSNIMKDMPEFKAYVPHGLRSTFRDWASEETQYQNETAELALAHKIASKTESSYRRGDQLEKRIKMMQDWNAHINKKVN